MIEWNSKKSYLKDLSRAGVEIIDTYWLKKEELHKLPEIMKEKNWKDCVIKPTVSCAGYKTYHFNEAHALEMGRSCLEEEIDDWMLQPFKREILEEGELSFVFINGNYSHSVIKKAAEGNFLVGKALHGGITQKAFPKASHIAKAAHILQLCGEGTLYGRIDAIVKNDALILAEAEFIEPVLFAAYEEGFTQKFASAINQRVRKDLLSRK